MIMANDNMRVIRIEKVTVNIGVGSPGDRLEHAKNLISRLTNDRKPVETQAKNRNPVFKLRKGMPIGVKVTLRGDSAKAFVEKALTARKRLIKESSFDKQGNFAFGVPEYIDFPGAKYDPTIGMFGFDVCVSLTRPGRRVTLRRLRSGKIGKFHRISKEEAIEFAKTTFKAKVE